MEHAFKDVPQCSFAGDDGISPYIGAASTISDYPDNPARQPALHSDVPEVAQQDLGTPALSLSQKLLRSGFGLSVFLHVVAALAIGYYATIPLPDEAALEGETIVSVEFYSETDSEVTTRAKQVDQAGEEEPVEDTKDEPPREEPKQEVVKPVEQEKPVEQARLPEPIEKPVETPPEKIERPVIGADVPEVLSTAEPSDVQIEAAAKQILEDTKIEPLSEMPPALIMPVEEKQPEPDKKLVQPLAHPVSKPRIVQKVAEVKPAEKPAAKKEEARKQEPEKPIKKKIVAREGNADFNSNKGSIEAKKKDGQSQDASEGNSRNRLKGNKAFTNYKGILERKLARAKKRVVPGAKGNVVIAFTVDANGRVINLEVRKSSGKPAVDKAGLEVVRKASPFPAIPADANKKSYSTTLPLTFR